MGRMAVQTEVISTATMNPMQASQTIVLRARRNRRQSDVGLAVADPTHKYRAVLATDKS